MTWKGRATLHSSRTREETPVGCRNPKVGLRNRSKSGSNGRSLFMTKKIVPAQFLVSGHVATRKRVFPIQTCRPPPPLSLTRTTWGSRPPRLTQPASTLWALKEANCQLCDRPPTYWSQWYYINSDIFILSKIVFLSYTWNMFWMTSDIIELYV